MGTALVPQPQPDYFMDATPEGRYRRDPQFRSLVDSMQMFIRNCQFTPTELREAAMLAAIHHERITVRSYFLVTPDRIIEENHW